MKSLSVFIKVFTLVLTMSIAKGNAQNEGVFTGEEIGQKSNSGYVLNVVAESLNKHFSQYDIFRIDASAVYQYVTNTNESFSVRLQLGDKYDWDLRLEPSHLLSDDFVLTVAAENGISTYPRPVDDTYKGYNNGFSDLVRMSIREHEVKGMVMQDGEFYFMERVNRFAPGAPSDWFVVYKQNDLAESSDAICSPAEVPGSPVKSNRNLQPAGNSMAVVLTEINMAGDWSFVNGQGGVSQAQKHIVDILNSVQGYYCKNGLDIVYELKEVFLSSCSTCDPKEWTCSNCSNSDTLLRRFTAWGNKAGSGTGYFTKKNDVAGLWTNRNLVCCGGNNTTGTAWQGVICSYNLQYSYHILEHWTNTLGAVVVNQTHELGHNWNAMHTSSCGNYIMCSSAGASNTAWDQASVTAILDHKSKNGTCLSPYSGACGIFTTGINPGDHPVAKNFFSYPNPNKGMLTVEAELVKASTVRLEISDMLGAKVASFSPVSVPAGTYKRQMDISRLSPGTYFLYLDADNQRSVIKIIKQE